MVEATYTVKSMAKPKRGRSTVATDNHVGGRIRERRIVLGLTQQRLAEMIGVTCQQAHKYERGINRVSAGRLFEIARALSAPITYFYEGIGEKGPRQITNDINAGSPGSQKAPTRSPARPWRHSARIDPDRGSEVRNGLAAGGRRFEPSIPHLR